MPVKYSTLDRKHASYKDSMFGELSDLYCGGYAILKRAENYLPRVVGEHPKRYKERLEHASYIPYFGEIIDFFVSNLFNQDLTVTPPSDGEDPETPGHLPDEKYYSNFYRNADRIGTPFADVVKAAFREGIIYQKGIISVDFPSTENNTVTKADEDKLGLADAYICCHDSSELLNWKKDSFGDFEWLVMKSTENITEVLSDKIIYRDTFKLWKMVGGFAEWSEYVIDYPINQPPKPMDDLIVSDSNSTKFKNIPVIVLEIPDGLWVGNKVGPLAKEHFRRRSSLHSSENKSMMAVPVAALGSEVGEFGGALPSEAQSNPNRGADPIGQFQSEGYVVTGKEDLLYYMEPSGNCYQIIGREISELRDEMFRVVHQMSQGVTTSGGGAIRRSGLSKIKDSEATVIILGEYGRIVRRFAEKIYKTISIARSEDVTWTGRGLDTFEIDSRQEVIDEATKVDMISIPSKTFKTEYKVQLALQIIGNTHASIQQAIRTEITAGVEQEANIFEGFLKQGMLPSTGMMMPPMPDGGKSSGGGNSDGKSAENIASGQVGKQYKPKQRAPSASAQPRQFGGKFGRKA